MIEVSYVGDFDGAVPPETVVVETDTDYVRVCAALTSAGASEEMTRAWVRRRNHFSWLESFAEQTRIPLSFAEKTARSILADLWQVSVPDWLTDEAVLQERLLDLRVTTDHVTTFENRILVHFFQKAFEDENLNSGNLAEVLSVLGAPSARRRLEQYPSLRRSLESKCVAWRARAKEPWLKSLCERLASKAEETWKELTCLALLHGYPGELLEFVVAPDRIPWLRSVPSASIDEIPLQRQGIDDALSQIDVFFKDIKEQIASDSDFRKVLERVSGKARREFVHLRDVLQTGAISPDRDTIRAFQERFRGCPGLTEAQLRHLERYVVPPRPSLKNPTETWTAQRWIDWAVREYFPFRQWQTTSAHYDEDLEQTVRAFSDWYTAEYIAVQQDPNLSLLNCLQGVAPKDGKPGLSVVLLIDCLPAAFYSIIDGAVCDAGFSRHGLNYRFAPLPTATEYSKPFLLQGSWELEHTDYRKILAARSSTDWAKTPVVYLTSQKDLVELQVTEKTAIVVLNLTSADELLHRDLESENLTHEDEVGRLFTRLAGDVRTLVDAWPGDRENVNVHVITDHGATQIREAEKTTLESKIVDKLFQDEKHRFARIPKPDAHLVPDNLWALGYKFVHPFIKQQNVFFIPRGHNAVKRHAKGVAYTHGGATPEEVLVPCGLYRPVKAQWARPATRFVGLTKDEQTGRALFYIQRVVAIEMELNNPNSTEMNLLRATVLHPDNELKSTSLASIAAGKRGIVHLDCYFRKAALGERDMELEIVYEIAGDTKTLDLVLPSEFRSAMSGGFNLKDL